MRLSTKVVCWTVPALLVMGCQQSTDADVSVEENETEEDTEIEEHRDENETDSPAETDDEEMEDDEGSEDEQTPLYTLNENNWALEPIDDDADEEAVLITVDDAPDEHGVEMAEALEDLDVTAIFFVNHHFINDDEGEDELLEIIEHGHEIGNHTMTHANLQELSDEEVEEEIVELNDEIERITGERPDFFRAPHGANTEYSWEVLEDEDMLGMNWTYGFDWEEEYTDADALADIMVETEHLQNGANILMHDREWTNEALEDIIKGIEEKGYDFINPSEIELENE